MAEYLSPGVYVEEFESGGRPLAGVSTSTAGFIGLAQRGPIEGLPELVTSFADFQRMYGGYLSDKAFKEFRYLSYAVEHFFINGGSRCYIMRVAPSDAKASLNDDNAVLKFEAKNPGGWGDRIGIILTPSSKAKAPVLEITGDAKYLLKNPAGFNEGDIVGFVTDEKSEYKQIVSVQGREVTLDSAIEGDIVDNGLLATKFLETCEFDLQVSYGDEVEFYEGVSLNPIASNYIEKLVEKSNLVAITHKPAEGEEEIKPPYELITGGEKDKFKVELKDGFDGSLANLSPGEYMGVDNGPGKRTGICSFIDNDEVSIMAVPGVTLPEVQLALVAHCENTKSRFAILDIPRDLKKTNDVMTHRNMFDSDYAAMYHPWLKVYDPLDKRNNYVPPSGSIAGIFARTDNERGVHKAPANEVVRACLGLDCQYNRGEQDILNPKGVNLIRNFTGQGIRVWGARTCSSNTLWKYINVRRLFIFIEESVKRGTDWVVFEPNDPNLWARVQRTIETFLTRVWRDGALLGNSESEAFFVKVDRTTMTQDDIDNGRLICTVGISPVKPAEFVIFRFTQKTSEN
ncbi:MAG: phage tail sheath family protein [Peptostreptococcaceae bacterium]|jgi:phage tail sheath protein FI|nr:phage tail sheath family protein [Peptostreptococcaceae bacterium]